MALYKHNQEVYDQIVDAMHEGVNDFCYVQDTGTGKSFIAMELIHNDFAGKKIAYVVPKHAIEVNMRKYSDFEAVDDSVTFFTYNYFDSDEKAAAVAAEYDVVFVDEAHHLGSDIYGTCLLRLRELICENKNKYFIGTTATPLREDGKDITEFFARSFQGLTVFDAIKQELMPKIEYLTCSMNLSKDEIKKFKDANIKLDIGKSTNLLREIVTTNDKNIWIVFFSRIEDIRSNEENIRALFPNHRMVIINSKAEEPLTKLAEIRQDEKVVILTVNMLLEGLHLDGVEGILNFRNTESLTVFRQMIGRILKIGNSHSPLVVDCSQSAYVMLRKLLEKGKAGTDGSVFLSEDHGNRDVIFVGVNNKKYFDIDLLIQKMRTGVAGRDVAFYQEIAKERGLECLATEYVGVDKKIPWRCSKGHVWKAAAYSLKTGSGCPYCSGRAGRDVSFYLELAKERGFECLATEYVGVTKKIPWRCPKGHVWEATPTNVKRGTGCPYCSGHAGRDVSFYQELAKERGFECLATEYVGVDKKIPWRCSKGHVWEASYGSIKRGYGCLCCLGRAGRDVSFYQEIAKERGFECLATEYVSVNKKIPWKCSKGHVWEATPTNVKRGTGCPVCRNRK